MWIVALLSIAAAEPTELEKERQKLIDMGIDPSVLQDLEAAAEQTVAIQTGLTELNTRLGMLQQALAKREDLATCQTHAATRLGTEVTGELALSVRVAADGTVPSVRELRRTAGVDAALSACVSTVLTGLSLPGDGAAQDVDITLTFPYSP